MFRPIGYIPKLLPLHPRSVKKSTMIAIIFNRNKIISYGFNTRKFYTDGTWTYHAEEQAIKKAGLRAKGAKILVVRIKKDHTYGLARPCKRCNSLINRAGIVKMEYTINV